MCVCLPHTLTLWFDLLLSATIISIMFIANDSAIFFATVKCELGILIEESCSWTPDILDGLKDTVFSASLSLCFSNCTTPYTFITPRTSTHNKFIQYQLYWWERRFARESIENKCHISLVHCVFSLCYYYCDITHSAATITLLHANCQWFCTFCVRNWSRNIFKVTHLDLAIWTKQIMQLGHLNCISWKWSIGVRLFFLLEHYNFWVSRWSIALIWCFFDLVCKKTYMKNHRKYSITFMASTYQIWYLMSPMR